MKEKPHVGARADGADRAPYWFCSPGCATADCVVMNWSWFLSRIAKLDWYFSAHVFIFFVYIFIAEIHLDTYLPRISYIRNLANIETRERVHVTRWSQPLNRACRRLRWSSGVTGGWRGGWAREGGSVVDAPRTVAAPRRSPVKAAPTLGGTGPRRSGTSSTIPGVDSGCKPRPSALRPRVAPGWRWGAEGSSGLAPFADLDEHPAAHGTFHRRHRRPRDPNRPDSFVLWSALRSWMGKIE
jgi:hypothetical protein